MDIPQKICQDCAMKSLRYLLAFFMLGTAAHSAYAGRLAVDFVYVALSQQKMPGFQHDRFQQFHAPHLSQGYNVFTAKGIEGDAGLFTDAYGFLRSAANNNTLVPLGKGTFTSFSNTSNFMNAPTSSDTSIVGTNIAFIGSDKNWNSGLYTYMNGQLQMVANNQTPIPGTTTGLFSALAFPTMLTNGGVGFWGSNGDKLEGIYYANPKGLLSKSIDTTTFMPRSKKRFQHFNALSFSRDPKHPQDFAFIGTGSKKSIGLYLMHDNQLTHIADNNTEMPAPDIGFFTNFSHISYDASSGRIAFIGHGILGQSDIFIYDGKNIVHAVTPQSLVPSAVGHFTQFSSPNLQGNNLIFQAAGSQKTQGVYLYTLNGDFFKVIANTDIVNKKHISSVEISSEAFSGNQVAVLIHFVDGSQGIYLATVAGKAY